MPDNNLFTQSDTAGPFSESLRPREYQQQQVSGPVSKTGGAMFLASKILEGAAEGRKHKFIESENAKSEKLSQLNNWVNSIGNDESITPEVRQKFMADAHNAVLGQVHSTLDQSAKGEGKNPHPLLSAARNIFEGMTGGQFKSTKPDPAAFDKLRTDYADILHKPENLVQTHVDNGQQGYAAIAKDLTEKLGRAPLQQELTRDPRYLPIHTNLQRKAGAQQANSIGNTFLGGYGEEPKVGSQEWARSQLRDMDNVPPPGAQVPGAPPQTSASLPSVAGSAALESADGEQPAAPPGAQSPTATAATPPSGMNRRLQLAILAGYQGKTITGKDGDKKVLAYPISGAGSMDGYRNANTHQLIPNFEPADSAADKKTSPKFGSRINDKGEKVETKYNPDDNVFEDIKNKDGQPIVLALPKAPRVGRGGRSGGGGGGKPVTPAQKIATERGYQSDLGKAKLKAYEDTGKINPAWTAPQQQAEKERIASQLSSATDDAHRKYQSTLASVGLEHYPAAPPQSTSPAKKRPDPVGIR